MSHEWRQHPQLAGRFHAESPDDLQVLVHDGGPRLTEHLPELVWARVLAVNANVFVAEVLNQPHQLTTVKQGDHVQFVVPASGDHPIMVTTKYLQERSKWVIGACGTCGFSELFDAPSDLIAKLFHPSADESVDAFTAICGICGGVQTVQSVDFQFDDAESDVRPRRARKWWQFWK